jgi:hypothetical protein
MKVLPRKMAHHEKCIILAPHFKNITDLYTLKKSRRIKHYKTAVTFSIKVGKQQYEVEVTEVTSNHDCQIFLISSDGFFTAPIDPRQSTHTSIPATRRNRWIPTPIPISHTS